MSKTLKIIASKIGEVLKIEVEGSYVKIPTRPMIIVEVHDINKLVGYIHIPSMAEGTFVKDTITQRILYLGFLTFVVESQIASLTFDLSFCLNLCFKCPNGSCEPILDIYTSITFPMI
jgi:C-terminal processing protease CtpA/Prc